MVHDEETDQSVERHEWEISRHVMIDDTTVFVGTSSKAEYVLNQCITIIGNEGWLAVDLIPWPWNVGSINWNWGKLNGLLVEVGGSCTRSCP